MGSETAREVVGIVMIVLIVVWLYWILEQAGMFSLIGHLAPRFF